MRSHRNTKVVQAALALLFAVALALAPHLSPRTAQATPTAKHPKGVSHAKLYRPGLMESVAAKRGIARSTYIFSTPYCSQVGGWLTARINGIVVSGPVADCSDPTVEYQKYCDCYESDKQRHIREKLVVEVNWNGAVKLGFSKHGHARATIISFTKRRR